MWQYIKKHSFGLLRFFIGVTFFAQGLRAFSHQPDFVRLVSESPLFTFGILPATFTPELFLVFVAFFDVGIALLLWCNVASRKTAIHGFVWICIVMTNSLIVGRIIETIDSVGYLGGLLLIAAWDGRKTF